MPWALTTPLVQEVHKQEILAFEMELATNKIRITLRSTDIDGIEIHTRVHELPILDSSGAVMMPSEWPAEYPSGAELYGLMKMALYGRLQEKPGVTGPGVLT